MTKILAPLNDRIIVQTIPDDTNRPSGIVLPQQAAERPIRARVVAVGEGRWNDILGSHVPLNVSVDDVVIFSKFGGAEIKIDDVEYVVLSENDVFAIERDAPPELSA